MYSDMSKRMSALSLPNRNWPAPARVRFCRHRSVQEDEAADRAVRVLQAGARAADRTEIAEIAFSWLITRLCRSLSIRSSLSLSS